MAYFQLSQQKPLSFRSAIGAGLGGLLLFISACTTTPEPRIVPVPRAQPTVTPQPIDRPIEADSADDITPVVIDPRFTPPHMQDREITRIAVLLPFSHPNQQVQADAESLLAGLELALFQKRKRDIIFLPKDTSGKRTEALISAKEAITEGADMIIGPLFSGNVQAVRAVAAEGSIPLVSFSGQKRAAGDGAYLISVAVETEVERVVSYVAQQGADIFAFFGPDTEYGRRAHSSLQDAAEKSGGRVIASEFYDTTGETPLDESLRLAKALVPYNDDMTGRVAVLIPLGGTELLSTAPLLAYNGVDTRRITLLGTSAWNDASVWREPVLERGLFATYDPEAYAQYTADYTRIYRQAPTAISHLGYDAGLMAISLAEDERLTVEGLLDEDGFTGVNGQFRFTQEGIAEHLLSVLKIDPVGGAVLVERGAEDFDPPIF